MDVLVSQHINLHSECFPTYITWKWICIPVLVVLVDFQVGSVRKNFSKTKKTFSGMGSKPIVDNLPISKIIK